MTDSIEELATKLEARASVAQHVPTILVVDDLTLLRAAALKLRECREALEPFANSLVGQTTVEHHSQDWREETDDTVVSITTSHQRKGMPYLAPDHTLWVGAFRRAAKALEAKQ